MMDTIEQFSNDAYRMAAFLEEAVGCYMQTIYGVEIDPLPQLISFSEHCLSENLGKWRKYYGNYSESHGHRYWRNGYKIRNVIVYPQRFEDHDRLRDIAASIDAEQDRGMIEESLITKCREAGVDIAIKAPNKPLAYYTKKLFLHDDSIDRN